MGMLKNFGHTMKLKSGVLKTKLKGNLTAIVWKDKQNTEKHVFSTMGG